MATLVELATQVDPLTAALVLGFWARWEAWRKQHHAQHEDLQRLVPHEVEHG